LNKSGPRRSFELRHAYAIRDWHQSLTDEGNEVERPGAGRVVKGKTVDGYEPS